MRYLGACSVMISSFCMGLLCLRERKRRLESLRALEEALRLMAGELSLRREALPELLPWLAGESRGSAALFFRCLTLALSRLGETSFAALWEETTELCFPELSRRDREELKRAGKLLGRFALNEQLSGLESCRRRLSRRLEEAEAAYTGERKLLLLLPTAVGFLLMIVLL